MGIRRLNIPSHYTKEELAKEKKRKTSNRSKNVRDTNTLTSSKEEVNVQADLI
jgi:site-specific DNA-methyltransferase (adenine-specific)/adenine-specific DNA-methyltransferase